MECWNNGILKAFHLIIPMLLFFQTAHGQILDTISASFHTRPRLFFQLDACNSFVADKGANTFGYKGGIEFNNRVKMGFGYYKLTSDIIKPLHLTYDGKDTTQNAELDMSFYSVSFEYIFYNKDPWQLSVPFNLGFGKSYFWYYTTNTSGGYDKEQTDKQGVSLITLNADLQYKIIKWVGVGGGLGFRLMLKDNSNISENFNSVIYSLQVRIFVDEIYKTLFVKQE